MRLKKSISKNNHITYSIIRDYEKIDGKRTTCIQETLGDYEKLQERFGEEDTMKKVQEYIDSLNQDLKNGKEPPVTITLDPNKQIEKNVIRSFYSGHIYLRKIYYMLGLDKICQKIQDKYKFEFDLNQILECLVYARVIWPSSKLATYEQSKRFLGNFDFDIQHIYRALDYIAKEMDLIQKELFNNSNKVIDRNYKVFYYDCTNFYFYTLEDDFKKYGYSKQHQPLPLVQMGLFMDADGYPIAININPGNTGESTTMLPTEKEILEKFNLKGKNIVVCTDAAMATNEIKEYNVQDGRGFVITQSIKKLSEELQNFCFEKNGWYILGDITKNYNLDDVEKTMADLDNKVANEKDEDKLEKLIKEKEKYYNTVFYKEIECETKSVRQTLIVTFSFKYRDYHHKIKINQLERAQRLVEKVNKNNENAKKKKDIEKIKKSINQNDPKRFIKETRTTNTGEIAENIKYEIDKSIFDEEEKYNGLYALTTNLRNDTSTILKVLNGRWEIEESFRIMKEEMDVGTVYLSNESRIKGHFITCFIALFIYRYLEHQLKDKYTVYEIIAQLKEMKALEHKGKGFQPTQDRSDLTDDLNQFLGVPADTQIITYKKLKKFLQ